MFQRIPVWLYFGCPGWSRKKTFKWFLNSQPSVLYLRPSWSSFDILWLTLAEIITLFPTTEWLKICQNGSAPGTTHAPDVICRKLEPGQFLYCFPTVLEVVPKILANSGLPKHDPRPNRWAWSTTKCFSNTRSLAADSAGHLRSTAYSPALPVLLTATTSSGTRMDM
jgi:hypothetical protein